MPRLANSWSERFSAGKNSRGEWCLATRTTIARRTVLVLAALIYESKGAELTPYRDELCVFIDRVWSKR